jgi:hypothetical protein
VNLQADGVVESKESKTFSYGGMQNIRDRIDMLDMPPDDSVFQLLEKGGKISASNVAVLVDGRGKDCPALLEVPRRVVGSASKEGDSKWSA